MMFKQVQSCETVSGLTLGQAAKALQAHLEKNNFISKSTVEDLFEFLT